MMSRKEMIKITYAIIFILLLDIGSKWLTQAYLISSPLNSAQYPFGGVTVFEALGIHFCIQHVTNRGAAWGVGGSWQHFILLARIVITVGFLFYLRLSEKAFKQRYALSLLIAGGLGNILDFFLYGHVIDMFHFTFWGYSYPVFNVADIAICIGIGMLLLGHLKKVKTTTDAPAQSS